MAKRLLTDRQRTKIRHEIKAKLSSGVPRKAVVKALSAKYKLSPITLRWYLRTQLARRPGGRLTSPPFAKVLNRLSDKRVKRLLAAKKLIPKLEAVRRLESELRGKIRSLARRLRAEESKARGIERRIKRLSAL